MDFNRERALVLSIIRLFASVRRLVNGIMEGLIRWVDSGF